MIHAGVEVVGVDLEPRTVFLNEGDLAREHFAGILVLDRDAIADLVLSLYGFHASSIRAYNKRRNGTEALESYLVRKSLTS